MFLRFWHLLLNRMFLILLHISACVSSSFIPYPRMVRHCIDIPQCIPFFTTMNNAARKIEIEIFVGTCISIFLHECQRVELLGHGGHEARMFIRTSQTVCQCCIILYSYQEYLRVRFLHIFDDWFCQLFFFFFFLIFQVG